MVKANMDIRHKALGYGIPLYQIAQKIGISETHFFRKLRNELNDEEKEKIFKAIEQIQKGA